MPPGGKSVAEAVGVFERHSEEAADQSGPRSRRAGKQSERDEALCRGGQPLCGFNKRTRQREKRLIGPFALRPTFAASGQLGATPVSQSRPKKGVGSPPGHDKVLGVIAANKPKPAPVAELKACDDAKAPLLASFRLAQLSPALAAQSKPQNSCSCSEGNGERGAGKQLTEEGGTVRGQHRDGLPGNSC